jgi:hypothetical protein
MKFKMAATAGLSLTLDPMGKVSQNTSSLKPLGQFDNELETRLLKSENCFHAQHLLPRAVDKLTDDHVATIYVLTVYNAYARLVHHIIIIQRLLVRLISDILIILI